MKQNIYKIIISFIFIGILITAGTAWCTEPAMGTYTSIPAFQTSAVQPNIMVLLDNSLSMNLAAYGTTDGFGPTITDDTYLGEPYNDVSKFEKRTNLSSDDGYEVTAGTVTLTGNLNLGYNLSSSKYTTGLRFRYVKIPAGATINSAYIQFTGSSSDSTSVTLNIDGIADDNVATFTATSGDISSRPATSSSVRVSWSPGSWTNNQFNNATMTPDLKNIVQSIVGRPGWAIDQALGFKITWSSGTGKRRAYGYDGDASKAPVLTVNYTTTGGTTEAVKYYGYFNPDYFYTYNTALSRFEHAYKKSYYDSTNLRWVTYNLSGTKTYLYNSSIVSNSLWDGNWMNWVSMRRFDVIKKVLVGGYYTRSGAGDYTVQGDNHYPTSWTYYKQFDASAGPAVSPYGNVVYYYGAKGGYLYTDSTDNVLSSSVKFNIKVHKSAAYDSTDFDSAGNYLVGVLQRIGDRARWGHMVFNYGTGTGKSGGTIKTSIGTSVSTVASNVSTETPETYTPLGEALYVAMQYFKQQGPDTLLDYPSTAVLYDNSATTYDPYYYDSQYVPCAKSFVLILTDGASTKDSKVPGYLKNYDTALSTDLSTCAESTAEGNCPYDMGGTDYLDDVALYAHTVDLRSSTVGKNELTETQTISLYTVLAFAGTDQDSLNAINLLKHASINGGFTEKDGDNPPRPNHQYEWDSDNSGDPGYGIPDNFFEASDGYYLEKALLNTINDILKKAASGTAVSVLSTSSEGEGNLIQAYFKPVVPSGLDEIRWQGYIQSLWVDPKGNLREDTVNDQVLDLGSDKIIKYFTDSLTGNTKVKVWNVNSTTPYPDTTTVAPDAIVDIDGIKPLWEGAKQLASRNPDDRKIFTFIDKNNDGVVEDSPNDPFDDTGEAVEFSTANQTAITPFLGIKDNTAWDYLGGTQEERAETLINYIRGMDVAGCRTRTLGGKVWKLGDIIHSTPVSVSKPVEGYDLIYGDTSYRTYYNDKLNRETVIYVGADDGMLHAFAAGTYNSSTKSYATPSPNAFGDELWAYIPQALLPHLKWLADPNYGHVYYCDLKPKVFDAKIDTNDGNGVSWHTLLLLGLNMGGKAIPVTDDFDYNTSTADTTRTFASSYSCLDITDPRNPKVLWERSYTDLELTTSSPAVVKVKNKWFAVFGSGPSDYDGTTTKNGHVFVVDIATGSPYQSTTGTDWLFQTSEANAFMNSPASVDFNLDYNFDAVYFGDAYYDTSTIPYWKGKLYKVVIPWADSTGKYDGDNPSPDLAHYSDNPTDTNTIYQWKFVPLFDATRPITSPISISTDPLHNLWAYVGSGRYLSAADKTNSDQQYMFGVKDPFYNKVKYSTGSSIYYHKYTTSKQLALTDLLDSDQYLILSDQTVYYDLPTKNGLLDASEYTPSNKFGTWDDLVTLARTKDGWKRSLTIQGERIVTKFTILGGIVFTPSFVPTANVCGFGGQSYLYGQYYETGTAYFKTGVNNYTLTVGSTTITQRLDKTSIGSGMSSSMGVHVGQEGAKGFIQTSSGEIVETGLKTQSPPSSRIIFWMEQ
jgi:type IV pilus assembly protein PilY1